MDIDETLIHGREEPLERECDFSAGRFFIYLRPQVREFLASVAEQYDLACWSSATKDYLDSIVNELMSELSCEPLFVWDRSRCTRRIDPFNGEEYFLKDLKKVRNRGVDLSRVIILEDEPRKVHRHYGNALYVKPYEGDIEDEELPGLARYLEFISTSPDFRKVEKRFWRDVPTF